MTKEECYKVLEVKPNVSYQQLNHNYKRLLKKYHPDTYVGDKNYATEKTMKIVTAYKTLLTSENFSTNQTTETKTSETKKSQVKQKPVKQVKEKKVKIKKPKRPLASIDADYIAIAVLVIIFIVLLVLFMLV